MPCWRDCSPASLIVYLKGDLGAGKTTLVRGFLRGLGYKGTVKSPTYTLIEPYRIAGKSICHLDLYRLADAEELEYLGVRDLLQEETVLLIEWPERGEGVLPSRRFDHPDKPSRAWKRGRDLSLNPTRGSVLSGCLRSRCDADISRIESLKVRLKSRKAEFVL